MVFSECAWWELIKMHRDDDVINGLYCIRCIQDLHRTYCVSTFWMTE